MLFKIYSVIKREEDVMKAELPITVDNGEALYEYIIPMFISALLVVKNWCV